MKVLKILKAKPALFFRLSGIRLTDFNELVAHFTRSGWKVKFTGCPVRDRQRAIGGGMNYHLEFAEQLLLCLMYYRMYSSYACMGLIFSVSPPTVCRRIQAMTELMAGHFRMPERKVRLSEEEKADLVYLMIDGTERPVQRPKKGSARKEKYSGKKKEHTACHQVVTDNKKRILAVGFAHPGHKHDKRIYDETRVDRPPDVLVIGDLGYVGTTLEVPLKRSKNRPLTKEEPRVQQMAFETTHWRRAWHLPDEEVQSVF